MHRRPPPLPIPATEDEPSALPVSARVSSLSCRGCLRLRSFLGLLQVDPWPWGLVRPCRGHPFCTVHREARGGVLCREAAYRRCSQWHWRTPGRAPRRWCRPRKRGADLGGTGWADGRRRDKGDRGIGLGLKHRDAGSGWAGRTWPVDYTIPFSLSVFSISSDPFGAQKRELQKTKNLKGKRGFFRT
jgi:hypothetical protein